MVFVYARKDGDWEQIDTSSGVDDAPSDNKTYGRLNATWSEIATKSNVDSKAVKMTQTNLTGASHNISLTPNTYYYFSEQISKITITSYTDDVGNETVLDFVPTNTWAGYPLIYSIWFKSLKPINFVIGKRTIVVIKGNILLYTQEA